MIRDDAPWPADPVVLSVRDAGDARARCDALPPQQPVVLLLADPLDDSTARALARQRAVAMLPAGVGAFRLRAAIEAVSVGLHVSGFTSFPRGAGRAASASTDARPDEGLPDEHLTPREVEVLELLGKGLTNADLGRTLRISSHTAKYHVAQILAKLGASSRAEAVHTGLRRGLIGL